jgi:hypothetical protein
VFIKAEVETGLKLHRFTGVEMNSHYKKLRYELMYDLIGNHSITLP